MKGEIEDRAANACAEYERWASEVTRLTTAIGAEECPMEVRLDTGERGDPPGSCFAEAASEEIEPFTEEAPSKKRTLDQIEIEVQGCESCLRLVGLIRTRRHARQRYGVAKRAVRVVGKAILNQGGEE